MTVSIKCHVCNQVLKVAVNDFNYSVSEILKKSNWKYSENKYLCNDCKLTGHF